MIAAIEGRSGAVSAAPALRQDPPSPADIERRYQVADDRTADWSPSLFGAIPLGGLGGTRELTVTEGRLLDNLTRDRGLLGLRSFEQIANAAFSVSEARVPPPRSIPREAQAQIDALPTARERTLAARAYPQNDGHTDAFRHAYWNARMSAEFGESWTRQFATAHEGLPGNGAVREAMDLYNNEVGRRIAVENPGASPERLADLVMNALNDGELVVVGRNGHLAFSDDVARGQHGFADPATKPGVIRTPAGDASAGRP